MHHGCLFHNAHNHTNLSITFLQFFRHLNRRSHCRQVQALQLRLHTQSVTLNQISCGGESRLLSSTSEKHACQACMHVDGEAEVKASRQRRCAIMMRQRRCALSWRASPECHTSMYGIYVCVTRPCTVSLQHIRCSAADYVQIYAVLALIYGMIDFLSLSQPSTSPRRNNLSEHRK